MIDFDVTGERRERNELINEIRRDVAKWRHDGQYGGVTPITRNLLQHWADEDRENRVIFAQREAAETAIVLTVITLPGRQVDEMSRQEAVVWRRMLLSPRARRTETMAMTRKPYTATTGATKASTITAT